MRAAATLLLACLALAWPALAHAVEPKTTLHDVEDEVMCVECGTALSVSQSPVAQQEREVILRGIAAGKTKEQIKAELVQEYGRNVLAEPSNSGVGIAAWWIPVALVPLALLLALVLARRWRRRGAADGGAPTVAGPALDPDDARRLDAELSAFDR
jgi:cytochrome c-type biogenesis protein CcmH